MSTDTGEPTPPADLCDKLRAAADRLIAGTPLHSDGKLTILSLAKEAQIKRWLLTHKYPHQLKDKYQVEFQAVQHKPVPVQAADREIASLREQLSKARAANQHLTDLNTTYAVIINQLTEDLETVTAERDALASSTGITRIQPHPQPRDGRPAPRSHSTGCLSSMVAASASAKVSDLISGLSGLRAGWPCPSPGEELPGPEGLTARRRSCQLRHSSEPRRPRLRFAAARPS